MVPVAREFVRAFVGRAVAPMWAVNRHITELVIWLGAMLLLVSIGAYVIGKVRKRCREEQPSVLELLSKFREVHSQGGLSDAEYRTIKTRLADRALGELKDKDETG
jgi:hypothetical protein